MPIDTRARTTITKPVTPTLSAHLRSRPALTPRLAGTSPASPASLSNKAFRAQARSPDRGDEEKLFALGDNITPRSGARISRLDPESPHTPETVAKLRTKSKPDVGTPRTVEQLGLHIQSPTPVAPALVRANTSEPALALPTRQIPGGTNASQAQDEAKFFRADDLRPVVTTSRIDSTTSKSGTDFHATSPQLSSRQFMDKSFPKEDKFFRADKLKTQPTSRPRMLAKASTFSTTSAPPSVRASTCKDPAPSVARGPTLGEDSSLLRTALPAALRPDSSPSTDIQSSSLDRRRSSSLNVDWLIPDSHKEHRKSSSVGSTTVTSEYTASGKLGEQHQLSTSPTQISGDSASNTTKAELANNTPVLNRLSGFTCAPTNTSEARTEPAIRPIFHRVHTRGLSETGNMRPLSQEELDTAASARRERKVLDLEISNSSLLAINRTLEKELRKQNSELRRFRRLSRSGRLSLAPTRRMFSHHSMSTLDTLDELDHSAPSDNSSEQDNSDEEDDDDSFSEEDSSTMDSIDVARRRARDEKKLLEDLSRHRQLLIDSQKLTQCIQRCLNSTHEMIKDGNQALSYQVGIGDLKLGGRVLTHDDDEEMSEVDASDIPRKYTIEPRQALLSPAASKKALEAASLWFQGLQEMDEKKDEEGLFTTNPESLSPIISTQWTAEL